jgi:hypothetical protein
VVEVNQLPYVLKRACQPECGEGLDYSVSKQKTLFEKCFGLRFKLTEGNSHLGIVRTRYLYLCVIDKAISFEFRHLVPAHVDESCSITLDVNSDGQWEGNVNSELKEGGGVGRASTKLCAESAFLLTHRLFYLCRRNWSPF